MNTQKKDFLAVILIILICFLVYSNIFTNEFVYDDKKIIVENDIIKDIKNIPEIFSTDYWGGKSGDIFYRPLVILSFAFNYLVGGLNPFGYHLVNVLFHAFNAILVFFLINLVFEKRWLSFLTALLFVIHPIQTETVTFIVGRADLFATFFLLFALFLYIKRYSFEDENKKKYYYIFSLFLFFLALLSKENAILLIGIIILYDFSFRLYNYDDKFFKKIWLNFIKRIKIYLGYLLVIILWIFIRFLALKPLPIFHFSSNFLNNPVANAGLYSQIMTGLKVTGLYLKLLLFPVELSADYSYNQISVSNSIFEPSVIFSFLVLFGLLLLAIFIYKKSKLIFFSVIFLIITIIPFSNLITPISTIMGERLLYLPSLGFCLLLAGIVYRGWNMHAIVNIQKIIKIIVIIFLVFILIFYFLISFERNSDWKDSQTLWTKTIITSPNSAKAHYNLGSIYYEQNLYDKAEAEYKKALEIYPDYLDVHNNLGLIYIEEGFYDKSIIEFKEASRINIK